MKPVFDHTVEPFLTSTVGKVPLVGALFRGNPGGGDLFTAGVILAIMILPIVTAVTREVVAVVPRDLREGALALGATRYERIRMAVLPYARGGIVGATMLGRGRGSATTMQAGIGAGPRSAGGARSRRLKSRAFTGFLWACGVLALLPLVFIVGYVVAKGFAALNLDFFTKEPAVPGQPGGGIVQSFIGTGIIMAMAIGFSVPLGVLAAVYLSEYGRGKLASAVRFVAEILLSTPSIVAGAFIWALVVVAMGTFSALAGAIALTVLMWPIIARATEEVLRLVPQDLREGALALGLPRWKVISRIVIPTAGAGIFTAIMLAMARGLGETAPILLTALGNDFVNWHPLQPTDAVPLRIFNYARTPVEQQHALAWGGAIMLFVGVLLLSILARVLSNRQQGRIR